MSHIKISPNLFLGSQELNKMINDLDINGYRQKILDNTQTFGIIKNDLDNDFKEGLVTVDGSNPNCVKIAQVTWIDKFGFFGLLPTTTAYAIPADGNWYWISISYTISNIENGTISIDTAGNLTGTGTAFKSILRGQPDFPSVIRLSGSVFNTAAYQVLSVTDDTHCKLQGAVFTAETNLKLVVFGTFTAGYTPLPGDRNIFVYDYCDLEQVLYNFTTPPAGVDGVTFYLARVQNTGGTLIIEDKRNLNIWQTRAEHTFTKLTVPDISTSIFGCEQVMWQSPVTDQSRNSAIIAWGFRSGNWTLNTNLNILTIIAGNGGIAKSTSDITNDQFNGWRVYTTNGTYRTVVSTVVVGTQINLYLNELNPLDFPALSLITIVPNAEEIEILAIAAAFAPNDTYAHNQSIVFPIQDAIGTLDLVIFNSGVDQTEYILEYRLKNNHIYSSLYRDNVTGNTYYNEKAFDSEGNLTDPSQTNVNTVSRIFVNLSPTSLYNAGLLTGDLLGWQNISNWSNTNPIINLTTGIVRNNVRFTGADFNPSQNCVINLPSTNARSGASFSLQIDQQLNYNPTVYSVTINQDYISAGSPGTVLWTFDNEQLGNSWPVNIKCVFNGTDWKIVWIWSESYVGTWVPYTPVLKDGSGTTVGGAITTNCRYKLIGKTLMMRGKIGYTSSGSPTTGYTLTTPTIRGASVAFQLPVSVGNGFFDGFGGLHFAIPVSDDGINKLDLDNSGTTDYTTLSGAGFFHFQIVTEIQ